MYRTWTVSVSWIIRCHAPLVFGWGSARSLVVPARGFEQLDRVAGRVVEQDLPDGDAGGPVVAEADAGAAQGLDRRVEVGDLDQDAVPPSGRRQRAVGQRVAAPVGAGDVQQEPQVAPVQHREHRGSSLLLEAQVLAVEVD